MCTIVDIYVLLLSLGTTSVIMLNGLASSVVGHGFHSRSRQINDYETYICCFSAKHKELRSKGFLGIMINVSLPKGF